MQKFILLIVAIMVLTGPVWDIWSFTKCENKNGLAAKQAENPFLIQVILKESKSMIEYTILDKLKKRKV